MFHFKINLGKAGKMAQSASNMFAKAHKKLSVANEMLEQHREEAMKHIEELQQQVAQADSHIWNNKKVQEKLSEFIIIPKQ